ncbi:hypothetical protein ONZ51_g4046 [Trametes cubensis]|uniref:Uncharacterized protein n=1 Tax=Trametes cubensis TaxID=1111947 RepID=A0AAD7XDD5_9APHY|nr:hypothetical protein ONZ51_g4046 [Trametes cubensis]
MSSPLLHLLGIPKLGSVAPIYIGVTLGMMLYGLTLHQAYRYYKHYPEDPWLYPKGLVTTILLLETLHTLVWMYIGYRYMVFESFNFPDILNSHWTIPSTFLVTSLSVFACQIFYCCRVYNFGAFFYKWILISAVVPICVGVTFGIVAGIEAFRVVKVLTDLGKISWMVSVAYGLSAGSDIILSSILVFALLRYKDRSQDADYIHHQHWYVSVPSQESHLPLDVFCARADRTHRLDSVVSFFAFLFAIVNRETLAYAGISIVGAKPSPASNHSYTVYANSVLALYVQHPSYSRSYEPPGPSLMSSFPPPSTDVSAPTGPSGWQAQLATVPEQPPTRRLHIHQPHGLRHLRFRFWLRVRVGLRSVSPTGAAADAPGVPTCGTATRGDVDDRLGGPPGRSTLMSQVSAVGDPDGLAGQITSSAIPEESEPGSTPAEAERGSADASGAV